MFTELFVSSVTAAQHTFNCTAPQHTFSCTAVQHTFSSTAHLQLNSTTAHLQLNSSTEPQHTFSSTAHIQLNSSTAHLQLHSSTAHLQLHNRKAHFQSLSSTAPMTVSPLTVTISSLKYSHQKSNWSLQLPSLATQQNKLYNHNSISNNYKITKTSSCKVRRTERSAALYSCTACSLKS